MYSAPLTDTDYQTCLHEAGHALAYIMRGKRFRSVQLYRGGTDTLGEVTPAGVAMTAEDLAFICMAGPAVEAFMGIELADEDDRADLTPEDIVLGHLISGTGGTDYRQAGHLAAHVTDDVIDAVREGWSTIIRIADRLFIAGELSYEETLVLAG